jgi:hypothetical protein
MSEKKCPCPHCGGNFTASDTNSTIARMVSGYYRTPTPEEDEDFNSYLIEDRLEMAARASASSVFVCKLMDEAAEKIKELRAALNQKGDER